MIPTTAGRAAVVVVVVLIVAACDDSDLDGSIAGRRAGSAMEPSNPVEWGCADAIPELDEQPPTRSRDNAISVRYFGFYPFTPEDLSGYRRHRRADIEVKLPVVIDGQGGATVWIPASERERVALVLADVPRRGPGESYRVEDGYSAVRFEACAGQEWTAWTAGLALADRGEITLMVRLGDAARPVRVPLGPWEISTSDRG